MKVLGFMILALVILALNLLMGYALGCFAGWLTGVHEIAGTKIEHWFVIASILFLMLRSGVSKA